MAMNLEFRQSLRMEQKLQQSPQMIQAMQVLQLTTHELMDRIEAELEENPFLELEDPPEGNGETENPEVPDGLLEDAPAGIRGNSGGREGEPDILLDLPAMETRGDQELLAELHTGDCPTKVARVAESLLGRMDARGFLPEGLEVAATSLGFAVVEVDQALLALRRVGHPALGACDLKDAYRLQLLAFPHVNTLALALVDDHFDELLANRLPQIASALGVGLSEVRDALQILSLLDTRPRDGEVADAGITILPDILMQEDDTGNFQAILVRQTLPRVRLSQVAHEALAQAKGDARLRKFLLRRIERARWFLDAVATRQDTLQKVADALVFHQRAFLLGGFDKLAPLKMQDVATATGMHISTVSRAVKGKHALTPHGISPLKAFFTGGQKSPDGKSTSRVAIQERIRALVEAENSETPLSDRELMEALFTRDNIKVARRTVTKYRKVLGIPASHLRQEHRD